MSAPISGSPPSLRPISTVEDTAPTAPQATPPPAAAPPPAAEARAPASPETVSGTRQRVLGESRGLQDALGERLLADRDLGSRQRSLGPMTVQGAARMEGGNLVATLGASVSAGRDRNAPGNRAQAGIRGSAGVSAEVRMPAAEGARHLASGQTIDPRRPETLPVGTRVTMTEEHSAGASAAGRVRGTRTGVGASVEGGARNQVELERLENNRVRVTSRQTEAEAASSSTSLNRAVSPTVGDRQAVERTRERTAEFDLGSADGRRAFDAFTRTGRMPDRDTPGVSGVTERDHTNRSTELRAGIAAGPVSREGTLGTQGQTLTTQTDADRVRTTTHARTTENAFGLSAENRGETVRQPDGSWTSNETLRNSAGGVPLSIRRAGPGDRQEDPDATRYQFSFPPGQDARVARMAVEGADPGANSGFRLEMTRGQLTALHQRAAEEARRNPANDHARRLAEAPTPDAMARMLASYGQGANGVSQALLALTADPRSPSTLPGTILPPQ